MLMTAWRRIWDERRGLISGGTLVAVIFGLLWLCQPMFKPFPESFVPSESLVGDLPTELLQTLAYCRGMERSLRNIGKRYPELNLELLAATGAWSKSPFGLGYKTIQENLLNDKAGDGRAVLKKLDDETLDRSKPHRRFKTINEARDFLASVHRRAKGEIESELVRGTLLWQCKPLQEHPEQEFAEGYVQKLAHPGWEGGQFEISVPMSWKEVPGDALISMRNWQGHGAMLMTIALVEVVPEKPMSAQEQVKMWPREAVRIEHLRRGSELTSFKSIKIRDMPGLMTTSELAFDRQGQQYTRLTRTTHVFLENKLMRIEISTVNPEGETAGPELMLQYEPLFSMIGGSFQISEG